MTDCIICRQLAAWPSSNALGRMLGDPLVRAVWLETPSFVVIPSIGALSVGHVLVLPKNHVLSFAELAPTADSEYEALMGSLVRGLSEDTGRTIHLFEHGTGLGAEAACSIGHAHQHLVPADVRVDVPAIEGRAVFGITSLESLRAAAGSEEYLYYRRVEPEGKSTLLVPNEHMRSQLMRAVFADALGRGNEWDWREFPSRSRVGATAALLSRLDSRTRDRLAVSAVRVPEYLTPVSSVTS